MVIYLPFEDAQVALRDGQAGKKGVADSYKIQTGVNLEQRQREGAGDCGRNFR